MQECGGKLETYLAMLPTRVIEVCGQPDLQPTAVAQKASKGEKAPGQCTGNGGLGGGTETDCWSGPDLD
jgi:hypothetical protein